MVQYSSKVASHPVALKSVRRLVENPLEHSVDLEGCVALVPRGQTLMPGPVPLEHSVDLADCVALVPRGQTLMPGPVLACHRLRECA